MSRTGLRVGDVVQIPLPDGCYAYDRVLRDASVAFHRSTSQKPGPPFARTGIEIRLKPRHQRRNEP